VIPPKVLLTILIIGATIIKEALEKEEK